MGVGFHVAFTYLVWLSKWSWKVKVKFRLIIFTDTLLNEHGSHNCTHIHIYTHMLACNVANIMESICLLSYFYLLSSEICMRCHVPQQKQALRTIGNRSMNESIEWATSDRQSCCRLHLNGLISQVPRSVEQNSGTKGNKVAAYVCDCLYVSVHVCGCLQQQRK